MPKDRSRLPWVNAWSISLNPERWETDGLYKPSTAQRSLRPMQNMYAGIFAPMTIRQLIQVELPYRIWLVGRGRLVPPLVRFLHKHLICDRPAMWLRRLFVTDSPSSPRDASVMTERAVRTARVVVGVAGDGRQRGAATAARTR
jgi:hypothetical protein